MWTLYACGLNPQSFAATEAAIVHNTFPEPDKFPNAERNADDRDAEQRAGEQIAQEQPEAAQYQPDDVQNGLHRCRPAICSSRVMRSAIGGWVENSLESP